MDTMARDPKYIAEQVRWLRQFKGLKQQNLAAITGLTTRTIEKIESGKHVPADQTLIMIARAFGMDTLSFFDKPTEERRRRQRAELERAQRKTVFVPISAVLTEHDAMALLTGAHLYNFDMSAVEGSDAVTLAAEMVDWIKDSDLCWADVSTTDQVKMAREFVAMGSEIEQRGYVCFTGSYRQQRLEPKNERWVVTVKLLTFLPKAQTETTKVAMLSLPGVWETVPEDRTKPPSI